MLGLVSQSVKEMGRTEYLPSAPEESSFDLLTVEFVRARMKLTQRVVSNYRYNQDNDCICGATVAYPYQTQFKVSCKDSAFSPDYRTRCTKLVRNRCTLSRTLTSFDFHDVINTGDC